VEIVITHDELLDTGKLANTIERAAIPRHVTDNVDDIGRTDCISPPSLDFRIVIGDGGEDATSRLVFDDFAVAEVEIGGYEALCHDQPLSPL
jgi:hypothetical protein